MRLIALIACLIAALTGRASAAPDAFHRTDAASTIAVDHGAWTAFLAAHVVPGANGSANLVRYGAVSADDRAALKAYIDRLEAVSPTGLNRDEAFVYWVNLYNAVTVDVILDHYPVKSIRDIKSGLISLGPWGRKRVEIGGETLSLDDIEHKILRPFFKDARVHFAVNCASIGCPDLRPEAWSAATLDADLDAAARAYVNSPRGVSVDGGKVRVSSIFRWFADDFGSNDAEILRYLAAFAEPDLAARLNAATTIAGHDYDWSLNEAK